MRRWVLVPAVLFLVVSCSSLEVKVAIADPKIAQPVIDEMRVRNQLPHVLAETEAEVRGVLNELTKKHFEIYHAIREGLEAEAKKAKGDEKSFLATLANTYSDDQFDQRIRPVYTNRKQVLIDIANQVRALCPIGSGCSGKLAQVAALLRERNEHLGSLRRFQAADLTRALREKLPEGVRAEAMEFRAASDDDIRSLIGSSGLQNSPEAFAVISADTRVSGNQQWKEAFDLSKSVGRLGDMNVAIKMERRGNFTIKGISFDPSEVARSISKMGTQLVLALAQTGGVPVRAATGTSPAAGFAASSERLGAAIDAEATAATERRNRREALLAIARAIAREATNLDGDEPKRKAAAKAIKGTFQANKARISTPPNP